MNKKKIENLYKNKIKLFENYNKFYYEKSSPKVSDSEFDNLKKEILSLEKNYTYLNSVKSPSKFVGHKPSKSFKKDLHRVPMLSLANAFDEDDLINFEKNIKFFI